MSTAALDRTPQPLLSLMRNGVSVWLDDLSRDRLTSGNLAELVATRGVVGVTTNPSIFQNAIGSSGAYAADLAELAAARADAETAVRQLTVDDVRAACDLLADIAVATEGVDGRVSLEVDPRLAHDTEATVLQARELWAAVGRPNLLIKIPATLAGLPAITRCLADGISVNVTLIFSVQRYEAVLDAFMSGIEHRLAAGHPVDGLASVASFFVSRVDTEVDRRLTEIGSPDALALRGQAAVANARLAYQVYERRTAGGRWLHLAGQGARSQRPLWASTGVKDPAYPDTMYVTELVAPNTVNTMPEGTLAAVAEHGEINPDAVRSHYREAEGTFASLAAVGIDLADVTRVLEDEGVAKFEQAWTALLSTVDAQLTSAR
ncbi:MAG: transaldolase [Jiangellales bacterium]